MIALLKYNAGNTLSLQNALTRLGYQSIVTDDIAKLKKADKVIFPGVGQASTAMSYLKAKKLDQVICNLTQPFLGICLGLQLMCEHSEEGNTKCLGIFPTKVKKFGAQERVPHMGWNTYQTRDLKLFKGIDQKTDVYYVHSYYAELCKETTATCSYNTPFSAALEKNNFYATQFHPEKSGENGAEILKNFLAL
jgi:imidazole glycerol-phosphate synthase subunit HisH